MKRLLFISLIVLLTSVASFAEDAFEVEYIFERQELPKGGKCLDLARSVVQSRIKSVHTDEELTHLFDEFGE